MNISEIKELIKAVSDSELSAVDFNEGNVSISLRKGDAQPAVVNAKVENVASAPVVETVVTSTASTAPVAKEAEEESVEGNVVKSPLVGTVYLSDEEGGEPLVNVGDTVKKGQTLAIVEAMKLMNEIGSEFNGTVKKVLVENGQTVEYDQPLFIIG